MVTAHKAQRRFPRSDPWPQTDPQNDPLPGHRRSQPSGPPVTHHHQTPPPHPSQPPDAPRQFVTGLTGIRATTDSSARPGRFKRIPNLLPLPVTHTVSGPPFLFSSGRWMKRGASSQSTGFFPAGTWWVRWPPPLRTSQRERPSWKVCPKATPPQPASGPAHAQ